MSEVNVVEEVEIWKDVVGYEGYYEVSNFGRILKLKGPTKIKTIVKGFLVRGYVNVHFCVNNIKRQHRVHRLVVEAFIPNIDNKPHVNHIDSNRSNNHISNLEWCTPFENVTHAIVNGRRSPVKGKDHPSSRAIDVLDSNMNFVKTYSSINEVAEDLGVLNTVITRHLRLGKMHEGIKRYFVTSGTSDLALMSKTGDWSFSMYDAVTSIQDVRHLIAIMFGETNARFIEKVLKYIDYPLGSPESFAVRLRNIQSEWIKTGELVRQPHF